MTDSTKAAKREARRQRAALERETKDRRRRQQLVRSRVLIVLGAAAVIALGAFLALRDAPSNTGRVWSPEHGHWHDR
jgi:hypothetical protein